MCALRLTRAQKGHLESRLAGDASLILAWTEECDGVCCSF